jgi:heme exporter protein D
MTEFLNMGGYAFYVWSAFGFSALVMAMLFIQPIVQHRQAWREAEALHDDDADNLGERP